MRTSKKRYVFNSRNELIVQVILDYFCEGPVSDRQGIIFCVNTKHTQEMEKLLLRCRD